MTPEDEKEFDNVFGNVFEGILVSSSEQRFDMCGEALKKDGAIKSFISDLLAKEREKKLETPMGVSQWHNYGKKFGYVEFFDKKLFEELRQYCKHDLSTSSAHQNGQADCWAKVIAFFGEKNALPTSSDLPTPPKEEKV